MDDRIAEIREALALVGGPAGESWAGEFFLVHQAVIDAARELLELLDSDALIIRRDDFHLQIGDQTLTLDHGGEWPRALLDAIVAHAWPKLVQEAALFNRRQDTKRVLDALGALASSQGVEP